MPVFVDDREQVRCHGPSAHWRLWNRRCDIHGGHFTGQVSLLFPATAHQSLYRTNHRTDGHSRTRNSAAREFIPRKSAEAVPGQWLHQLPVPGERAQRGQVECSLVIPAIFAWFTT